LYFVQLRIAVFAFIVRCRECLHDVKTDSSMLLLSAGCYYYCCGTGLYRYRQVQAGLVARGVGVDVELSRAVAARSCP
jgi:hypothetical protein